MKPIIIKYVGIICYKTICKNMGLDIHIDMEQNHLLIDFVKTDFS